MISKATQFYRSNFFTCDIRQMMLQPFLRWSICVFLWWDSLPVISALNAGIFICSKMDVKDFSANLHIFEWCRRYRYRVPLQRYLTELWSFKTLRKWNLFRTSLCSSLFSQMNSGADDVMKMAQCHLKISEVTLMTLNGYLDWVPMSHITIKDSLLLQMLCLLLSHATLQLPAAECLYTIVSRRVSKWCATWQNFK